MKKHLSVSDIKKFKKEFESCNHCKNTMNGLTRSKLEDISMNWESYRNVDHNYSNIVKGEISLNKRVISSKDIFVQPEKREIALSFQENSLFPHLNIFENLKLGQFRKTKKRFLYR